MHSGAKYVIECGDRLFTKRGDLPLLWQDIAENFYPERADFTVKRSLGEDFASNLMTSYPCLARRDLGNSFGAMLRPTATDWFHIRTNRPELSTEELRWFQWAEGVQRRAMYDMDAKFLRATKEGDHDFAAFGQCVITVEIDYEYQHLMYRTWHLRDTVWCDSDRGTTDEVHRKWRPTPTDLMRRFRGRVHQSVRTAAESKSSDAYREIDVRHVVMPSYAYEGPRKTNRPFWLIQIDVENAHVLEEVPISVHPYVIPRWQTVSGSQYAHSPATVVALPEARLLQAVSRTLLEAGEKYVNPPMIAVQEALRSDVNIYAGGVTWAQSEYDERLGEVLRPLTQEKGGMAIGRDMRDDTRSIINECFYLSKLALPPSEREMTAFETGQRVQEYIRQALPIFEPMEPDYNGALCLTTFRLLMQNGAFGRPDQVPESLRYDRVQFDFESPLHEALGRMKGQRFLEAGSLLAQAAQVDPRVGPVLDAREALQDTLKSIGIPAKWMRTEEEMDAEVAAQEATVAAGQILEGGQAASEIAVNLAKAGSLNTQAAA